jgi:hypothetical protein
MTAPVQAVRQQIARPLEESIDFLTHELREFKNLVSDRFKELDEKKEEDKNKLFVEEVALAVGKRRINEYVLERIRNIMNLGDVNNHNEYITTFLAQYNTPSIPAADIKRVGESTGRTYYNSKIHLPLTQEEEISRMWRFVKSKLKD